MSDESNGNGSANGNGHAGIAALFSKDEIDVPLNVGRMNDYSGITFYFGPMDARTDSRYSQILQRNVGKNKSTQDEAIQYVFRHKLTRVVFEAPAKDAESELRSYGYDDRQIALFNSNPAQFFLSLPDWWRHIRPVTYKYLNEVSPEAGDSKSDF